MTCAHAHTRTHTPHDPGPHPRPPKPPLRTPASQQGRRVRLGRLIHPICARSLMGDRAAPPPRGGLGLRSRLGLASALTRRRMGWRDRGAGAAAAACSERRAGVGQRLEVRGALCVAGARSWPARRAVRASVQAARPGLRVSGSAARRPARSQRLRHASRVAADKPFLPFGPFFFYY